MLFLLALTVLAEQSAWRQKCDSVVLASWDSIEDKTSFGKAFFSHWIDSDSSIEAVFAKSNFPQGPAQFMVERMDTIFGVLGDEEALAGELQTVAKTHVSVGVSQSDIYSFQKSFIDTLPAFTSSWDAESADAWAYVLSHVIVSPLVEMGSSTSTYMGVRTVKKMWNDVDHNKVCDKLFDYMIKDSAIQAFFKGVSKKIQSALLCGFVSTIMKELTLPGDDTYKQSIHLKQLAAFHSGMGVGAELFLSFEYYLMKSFEKSMTLTKDMKNSLVHTLHVNVFDRLVRYSQKWKYAEWKSAITEVC